MTARLLRCLGQRFKIVQAPVLKNDRFKGHRTLIIKSPLFVSILFHGVVFIFIFLIQKTPVPEPERIEITIVSVADFAGSSDEKTNHKADAIGGVIADAINSRAEVEVKPVALKVIADKASVQAMSASTSFQSEERSAVDLVPWKEAIAEMPHAPSKPRFKDVEKIDFLSISVDGTRTAEEVKAVARFDAQVKATHKETIHDITEIRPKNAVQTMSSSAQIRAALTYNRANKTGSSMDDSPPGFGLGSVANPAPEYPEKAREKGQEGTVLLLARVSEKGQLITVLIKKSSGFGRLDRAALKAVKTWKFKPAIWQGHAVSGQVKIPIVFQLTS